MSCADCLLDVVIARLKTSAESPASWCRYSKNPLPYRSSKTLLPVRTASSSRGQASQVHGSVHHSEMYRRLLGVSSRSSRDMSVWTYFPSSVSSKIP